MSFRDEIYAQRLWGIELSLMQGVEIPLRKTYVPQKPGRNLPTIEELEKMTNDDLVATNESDTLYILKQYITTIPHKTQVITMVHERNFQEVYNRRKVNSGESIDTTIHFHRSVKDFVNERFENHPLAGEIFYYTELRHNLSAARRKVEQLCAILKRLFIIENNGRQN